MPIDARIALMGQPLQLRDFDPIKSMQAAAQLKAAQNEARLADLKYREAERGIAEERTLREAFGANMSTDPQTGKQKFNEAGFLSAYGRQNPIKSLSLGEQLRKGRAETQKADLETQMQQLEVIGQVTTAIKAAALRGEDPQMVFDRGIQSLARMGIPVDHLKGQRVDMRVVDYYQQEAMTAAQSLAQQKEVREKEQFEKSQATIQRGQNMTSQTAQEGHDVTMRGHDISAQSAQAGHAVTMRGQNMTAQTAQEAPQRSADAYNLTVPGRVKVARETQAEGLAAQGQKVYDAAVSKNRAELEHAPMGEAMAERISNLNTLVRFTNDISALRQNNFTGPVQGPLGELRELTGNITDDEVQFRGMILDATDMLGRIRSQGAITKDEEVRFAKMLPSSKVHPNVFIARMESFGRAIEIARDEKIKMATTPRGKLLETAPRVTPTQGKTISRAQVQQIMQLKGKTESEVIEALKEQRFTVR